MVKFKKKSLPASSKSWLRRSQNDLYTNNAVLNQLPSRSFYKLEEIQNKYKLFRKDDKVLDLGCSPGGWSYFLNKYTSHVHGCDLLNTLETKIEKFILGNFLHEEVQKEFEIYSAIVSDMAINATGNKWMDQYKNHELACQVWDFVKNHLLHNGHFVIKLFESEFTHDFVKEVKKKFQRVEKFKPKSSYQDSSEIYLVAIKYIKINESPF
jgi:23S rRNA (uridine2552-2'-O)-methyltransferase